jgi:hypothetical protein
MQEKQKSKLWNIAFGLTAVAALVFAVTACPMNASNDSGGGPAFPPEKPRITAIQTGFELLIDKVDLKNVTDAVANDPNKQSAVVAFTWEGEGATTYNVYWREKGPNIQPPASPNDQDIVEQAYFARNLKPDMDYYFWIEAVNAKGKALSDRFDTKTGKPGPHKVANNNVGVERGDYPRGMKVVPGSGSLTVSWDLSDRVGWYEVYYTEKDAVKHLDIYTPKEFRYDGTKPLKPGVIDISAAANASSVAYQARGAEGHTRPVYPFLSPLASGWEGYYVRDGVSRVDNDNRPILGTNQIPGTFYKIMEIYDQGIQDPYKKLDEAFARATPWDGMNKTAGTAGTPVKFYGTSVTITGLTDGTPYDVWVRSPNANGERGYSYITGTPGAGAAIGEVTGVQVSTPVDTTQNLSVSWSATSGATGYRVYVSKYDMTPGLNAKYGEVSGGATTTYLASGLEPGTTYYVWVVAVKNNIAGAFGSPQTGETGKALSVGKQGIKTITGTKQTVKTVVYVEVNDHNPLNAGNYVLEDGTFLFDYVVLFAANIRNRNPNGTGTVAPYVHLNDNVQHILTNRTKYIKPLQDKGIKVILGLLGDHDGVSFGTMNDADIAAFATDVKKIVDLYQLDGVDFDDEWGSKEDWDGWTNNYKTISPNSIWTYPTSSWGWPTSVTVYRDPSKGVEPNNGTLTAPSEADMDRMWKESGANYYKTIKATRDKLGNGKIVSLYEYNTGRYITPGGAANTGVAASDLAGVLDYALQPWYNRYIADSANGLPRSIYSPFGMDLGGQAYSSQNGAPNPPIAVNKNEKADNTIFNYATQFKKAADSNNAYNMLYFYALTPSSQLLKHQSSDAAASITKENYISRMTEIVFGQKCVITSEGERGDYRKDW